ncbi:MAG: type II toxin-antitoxin system VapC family toxin [Dehalococcoidia bacterium]|nr:type II toxin-antitoxin system VapC family toxin [Dehalococcoidia bacterium]
MYLDANVLVGATVRRHALYTKAAQLIGELLASQARILVSLLAVQEALWALANISYCELYNQPSNASFTQTIYNRWREQIFQKYGPRMQAIGLMLRDWSDAGVAVEVVPKTDADFLSVCDLTPRYMRDYKLTTADAAHLALAETHAASFVTADSHFKQVATQAPPNALAVVHLVP